MSKKIIFAAAIILLLAAVSAIIYIPLRKANAGIPYRETYENLAVSADGDIVLIEDGVAKGGQEYINRISTIYSDSVKEIILDEYITILGENGTPYSEFEVDWERVSSYMKVYGQKMMMAEAFFGLNENHSFIMMNGESFPSVDFMVLLDNGTVAGIGCDDKYDVVYDTIKMYSLESGERIVCLSGGYALTDTGSVWNVDREKGVMTRLEGWDDIIAIDGFEGECVGIREDGTVCYYGENRYGQADCISGWKGISDVELGRGFCIGLTKEGQVVASFRDEGLNALRAVESWSNIRAIGTDGYYNIVGLRSDGGYNLIVR